MHANGFFPHGGYDGQKQKQNLNLSTCTANVNASHYFVSNETESQEVLRDEN